MKGVSAGTDESCLKGMIMLLVFFLGVSLAGCGNEGWDMSDPGKTGVSPLPGEYSFDQRGCFEVIQGRPWYTFPDRRQEQHDPEQRHSRKPIRPLDHQKRVPPQLRQQDIPQQHNCQHHSGSGRFSGSRLLGQWERLGRQLLGQLDTPQQ